MSIDREGGGRRTGANSNTDSHDDSKVTTLEEWAGSDLPGSELAAGVLEHRERDATTGEGHDGDAVLNELDESTRTHIENLIEDTVRRHLDAWQEDSAGGDSGDGRERGDEE